jgi:hypothetical protein
MDTHLIKSDTVQISPVHNRNIQLNEEAEPPIFIGLKKIK